MSDKYSAIIPALYRAQDENGGWVKLRGCRSSFKGDGHSAGPHSRGFRFLYDV